MTQVTLRPLEEGDAERVVAWRNRPEVHAQLFSAAPPTLDGHRRWFAGYQTRDDRQEFVILADGQPVGTIGLSNIDRVNRRAEYGVMLGEPAARGRGVAHEASRQLIAHAFGTLGLARLYLHVFPENESAVRLYERLGFRREGVLRAHLWKDGRSRDLLVMGLLAGEQPGS